MSRRTGLNRFEWLLVTILALGYGLIGFILINVWWALGISLLSGLFMYGEIENDHKKKCIVND